MKNSSLLFIILSLSFSCSQMKGNQKQYTVGHRNVELGSVNGQKIFFADNNENQNQTQMGENANKKQYATILLKEESDWEQRKFQIYWAALEDKIDEKLIVDAAAKAGKSVEVFSAQEIAQRIQPIGENEVRSIYEQYKDRLGGTFAEVEKTIQQTLEDENRKEARRNWMKDLRKNAEISYNLPSPKLVSSSIAGTGPLLGNPKGKVKVVQFMDFECPFCSEATKTLEELVQAFPNDLMVEFRNYPLSQHPRAFVAAKAAICADQQNKFWPYHDLLFENFGLLEDSDLTKYAFDLGLDKNKFISCMDAQNTQQKLENDINTAKQLGVTGTPAIFMNGKKLNGMYPFMMMKALIESELQSLN